MKVYLIRHAESEENALDFNAAMTRADFNDILRRSFDSGLTGRGEQQARDLIERMSHTKIERLYSSPFKRAFTTALILGNAVGLTPQIVDDLREVLPSAQRERSGTASLRQHFIRSYTKMLWPISRNETWAAAYVRGRRAWLHITAEPAAEIAAVAHRGTIGVILLSLSRNSGWRILSRDLSNGGISIVEKREENIKRTVKARKPKQAS
jgi:broad specificity phosphatase PhoE